jgi:flavin-binding protein dodecin
LEDTLKEFMEITGQSTIQVLQSKSSLEDALKEFMDKTSQTMQELKNVIMVDSLAIREIEDATMANTSAIQRLEGQLNHLVFEFNRIEAEEFQG